jgi:hypothetical protein
VEQAIAQLKSRALLAQDGHVDDIARHDSWVQFARAIADITDEAFAALDSYVPNLREAIMCGISSQQAQDNCWQHVS